MSKGKHVHRSESTIQQWQNILYTIHNGLKIPSKTSLLPFLVQVSSKPVLGLVHQNDSDVLCQANSCLSDYSLQPSEPTAK